VLRRFEFTVYDQPRPLGRARVNTKTGRFYTTSKDQNARLFIRAAFLEVAGEPWEPLQGPLRLQMTAWLRMPKSIPKKRQKTALPSKRPDLDNYIKQVEDALNRYAFMDDGQIVTIEARKRYIGIEGDSRLGAPEVPCWRITLDEIEDL
jgi:Holliday junction resolvase RusA-like endonuclease